MDKFNQINFLWDISKALSEFFEPEKIIHSLGQCFKKYLNCNTFEILIFDKNTLSVKNFSKNWIILDAQTQSYYKEKIFDVFHEHKNSIIINSSLVDIFTAKSLKVFERGYFRENLYLPLVKKGKVFGIMEIGICSGEPVVSKDFLKALDVAVYQISSAIINNLLNSKMQVSINFHNSMKNIAKIIENQYELNYIIPIIGEMIDRFVSSHLVYIFKYETGKGFSLLWPSACHEKAVLENIKSINKNSDYIVTEDKKTGIFPLIQEKTLMGAIVAHSSMDVLSNSDIAYLEQLSKQSAITIARANVYAEILKHATLDALTGLNNRRQFDTRLRQEVSTAKRKKKPLCCIMIDVDYFKKVNDTYGHIAGDCVLKQVAKIIQAELREYDIASRYGGEEFSILLPFTSVEEAYAVAQRLRKAVEAAEMNISEAKVNEKIIKVTASFGVSKFSDDIQDPKELYKRADKALYDAKEHGRNKVIVYSK